MASELAEETIVDPDSVPEEEAPSRKIDFGSKKIKIVALLIVVMGVEAAAIYFLVPPPAHSGNPAGNNEGLPDPNSDPEDNVDTTEHSIGTFNITVNQTGSGVFHLTFELVAIVARDSLDQFKKVVEKEQRHRVRQAIVKVARSSSLEEITDPQLDRMKRLIREEVNKVLGRSYIIEVVFPDFKYIEQ